MNRTSNTSSKKKTNSQNANEQMKYELYKTNKKAKRWQDMLVLNRLQFRT